MLSFFRKKVSGNKNRHEESGFNLDLTYITPRIIAMSLPGEGFQKIYRNSIDSVSKFLNTKHGANCRVLNLSGLQYNYEKFNNNVTPYSWQDHHPPDIELLFRACQEIHSWLCQDKDHVVAINCKAGKGRTGTLICCYLIYCGKIENPADALNYYKVKRFKKGGGVTQPSQVRYVYYFSDIFSGKVRGPAAVSLQQVLLRTVPHISGNGCRPVFELFQGEVLTFTNKRENRELQKYFEDDWRFASHLMSIANTQGVILVGDIQCNLTSWGLLKMQKICRFTFNTSFVCNSSLLTFKKHELDPDYFKKSPKVSEEFEVVLGLKKQCEVCDVSMEAAQRCEACIKMISEQEFMKWGKIKECLAERMEMNPSIVLFPNPEEDDFIETLSNVNLEDDASDGSVE